MLLTWTIIYFFSCRCFATDYLLSLLYNIILSKIILILPLDLFQIVKLQQLLDSQPQTVCSSPAVSSQNWEDYFQDGINQLQQTRTYGKILLLKRNGSRVHPQPQNFWNFCMEYTCDIFINKWGKGPIFQHFHCRTLKLREGGNLDF